MEIDKLYFLHARLNQKLFKGKLEAVIIRTFCDYEEDIEAQFESCLDPYVIWFNTRFWEDEFDPLDDVYIATILLHEMIHQYNHQRGIEDIDQYTVRHNAAFKKAAAAHGMTLDGYNLTPETEKLIQKELEAYEQLQSIKWRP